MMPAGEQLYIGLDVGHTIRGAVVREGGTILLQRRVMSEVSKPEVLIEQLIEMIAQLRSADEAAGQVVAAGVGWSGLVNHRTQRVEVTPNIVDVSSYDLCNELKQATGLRVVLENDANVAAYGEWHCGAARGSSDVFYVGLGTGIGSALILGGKLQRGSRGFAGEFGHFKIDLDGLECGCGGIGCLETVASGPNIVRRVREQLFRNPAFSISKLARDMEGKLTAERVVQAAMEHDELAGSVLRETGRVLGSAVASVINLLNVEVIVMGGGLMAAGQLMLEPIRAEIKRSAIKSAYDWCDIVTAQLGQDAGIIGAALMARDAVPS